MGQAGRIHCSAETADLLSSGGKTDWLSKRVDPVTAGGVGIIQTFWVKPNDGPGETSTWTGGSISEQELDAESEEVAIFADEGATLKQVRWNTELLFTLLENWVAARDPGAVPETAEVRECENAILQRPNSSLVIHEFTQELDMPSFNPRVVPGGDNAGAVAQSVKRVLFEYVLEIAKLYKQVRTSL